MRPSGKDAWRPGRRESRYSASIELVLVQVYRKRVNIIVITAKMTFFSTTILVAMCCMKNVLHKEIFTSDFAGKFCNGGFGPDEKLGSSLTKLLNFSIQ